MQNIFINFWSDKYLMCAVLPIMLSMLLSSILKITFNLDISYAFTSPKMLSTIYIITLRLYYLECTWLSLPTDWIEFSCFFISLPTSRECINLGWNLLELFFWNCLAIYFSTIYIGMWLASPKSLSCIVHSNIWNLARCSWTIGLLLSI